MAIFSLPVSGYVTQSYGKQSDGSFHPGIDFHAPVGTPIKAIGDGVISTQTNNGDCGNTLIIQHPNGYESVYCHLSNFLLQPGAAVKQGEIIGFTGGDKGEVGAGNSTVPHLHLQIDKGKGAANNVDPTSLLGLTPGASPTPSATKAASPSILDRLKSALGKGALNTLIPGSSLLNDAGTSLNSVPGVSGAKTAIKGFTSVADLVGFISNPANLKRVGTGAIGVTLVVIAGVELLKESPVGSTITKVASKVA